MVYFTINSMIWVEIPSFSVKSIKKGEDNLTLIFPLTKYDYLAGSATGAAAVESTTVASAAGASVTVVTSAAGASVATSSVFTSSVEPQEANIKEAASKLTNRTFFFIMFFNLVYLGFKYKYKKSYSKYLINQISKKIYFSCFKSWEIFINFNNPQNKTTNIS